MKSEDKARWAQMLDAMGRSYEANVTLIRCLVEQDKDLGQRERFLYQTLCISLENAVHCIEMIQGKPGPEPGWPSG